MLHWTITATTETAIRTITNTLKAVVIAALIVGFALVGSACAAKENFDRSKPHVIKEQSKKQKNSSKKKPREIVVVGSDKAVEVAPQAAEAQAKKKAKRDAASGMATGKRQHKPVSVAKELDKSSPKLMDGVDFRLSLKEEDSYGVQAAA